MPLDCYREPDKGEPPHKGTITVSLDPNNMDRIKVEVKFPNLLFVFYFLEFEAVDHMRELGDVINLKRRIASGGKP